MRQISIGERKGIIAIIKQVSSKGRQVLLSYLIGSFVRGDKFRDIDVAVYLEPTTEDIFSYGLRLGGG